MFPRRLYRAVSVEEEADIRANGLRPGLGAMETKLFVLTAVDAVRIGRDVLYRLDGEPFFVVEVVLGQAVGSNLQAVVFPTDFGTPTVALGREELSLVNRHARFETLAFVPIST